MPPRVRNRIPWGPPEPGPILGVWRGQQAANLIGERIGRFFPNAAPAFVRGAARAATSALVSSGIRRGIQWFRNRYFPRRTYGIRAHRGSLGRTYRRTRRMIRRAWNKVRRNRRRRIKRNRRNRRRRHNPYTNKREANRRRIVAMPRYQHVVTPYSGRTFARRNGWYSIGRWYLLGKFTGNAVLSGSTYANNLSLIYVDVNAAGSAAPVGSGANATLACSNQYNTIWASPHFNVIHSGDTSAPGTGGYVQPSVSQGGTYANTLSFATCQFTYGSSTTTPDTGTAYAFMPPVPRTAVSYVVDIHNPGNVAVNNNTSTGYYDYYLPYRCYWPRVYAEVQYSIKVVWPSAWGSTHIGTNIPLPPNPPFYVRLIGLKTRGGMTPPNFAALVSTCFSNGASINSSFISTAKSNLRINYNTYIFFDKLWMFNGRMIPQFQAGEVLTDGEESSFVTACPIGYTNRTLAVNSQSDNVSWQAGNIVGGITWYLMSAFVMDPIPFEMGSASQLVDLRPTYSCKFNFSYYCYPRFHAPDTPQLLSGYGTAYGGALTASRVSASSEEAGSKVVAAGDVIAAPALESQGSSLPASTSFSSSNDDPNPDAEVTVD